MLASPLMTALAEHVWTPLRGWRTSPAGAGSAPRSWRAWMSFRPPRRCRRCVPGWPTSGPWASLHLRRPDVAPAGDLLRRGRSKNLVRADQQHRCVRRRQGRALLPRGLRPDRYHPGEPDQLQHGTGRLGAHDRGQDVPILRPEQIRQLPQGQALVIAENARPLIAKLHRCIKGKAGKALLAAQDGARQRSAVPAASHQLAGAHHRRGSSGAAAGPERHHRPGRRNSLSGR